MVSATSALLRSSEGRADCLLGSASEISGALRQLIGPVLQNTSQSLEITLRGNICGPVQAAAENKLCAKARLWFCVKMISRWVIIYVN